ncbi:hypothetical protein [Actinoplanes cyaneus]|uniref:hypothetical protein n=1 Tax=Actinoplanes cyaneus TaxID=52696 RepID=UPI001944AF61|nr:hypothetical protein [Actinoplanes cyaneus]
MGDAATAVGTVVDGFFGVLNNVARGGGSGAGAGSGWATGSAECCVCPVCRAIAAARNPSPETVFKVATGAGDIATGAASMLRGFSALAGSVLNERPAPRASGGGAARHAPSADQAWSAATRTATPSPAPPAAADPEADPWAAATAESAREADAARARARAAEQAVAQAVADARRTAAGSTAATGAPGSAAAPATSGTSEGPAATGGTGSAATGAPTAVPEKGESDQKADPAPGRPAVRKAGGDRRRPRGDVWSVVTSEAAADDAAGGRSVDHERGAEAPEDRGVRPGDDARDDDAV